MPTRFPVYQMQDGVTPLSADYFNPIWQDLDGRLAEIEAKRADLDYAITELQQFGLDRIDGSIGPVLAAAQAVLEGAQEQYDALIAAVGDATTLVRTSQLEAAITAEQSARASAIAAEQSARASAIAAEQSARTASVAALQEQMDAILALALAGL